MGFLFRRRPALPTNQIYGSEEEKWDACFRQVREGLEAGLPVLVVAHFKDSLTFLVGTLEASAIPWEGREQLPPGVPPAERVTLAPASAFATDVAGEAPTGGQPVARAILTELHPATGHDEQVVRALWSRPFAWDIRRLTSLEDPVLAAFCGPTMVSMLRGLGIGGDEDLHSPMIDRAIARAQARLTCRAPDDRPYDNAAAWLQDNLYDRRR